MLTVPKLGYEAADEDELGSSTVGVDDTDKGCLRSRSCGLGSELVRWH